MRDRTIVIAFFGLVVAGIFFTAGNALDAAIGVMVLIVVGIILGLEPRKTRTRKQSSE